MTIDGLRGKGGRGERRFTLGWRVAWLRDSELLRFAIPQRAPLAWASKPQAAPRENAGSLNPERERRANKR